MLVILLLHDATLSHSRTFFLGFLFPWEGISHIGSHSAGAISVAIDMVHRDKDNQFPTLRAHDHRFNFTWADTSCKQSNGLPLLLEMYYNGVNNNQTVDAFIGPVCSVICEPAGHLITYWKIPIVSWGCTSSVLSDKSVYPTFARTTAPNARSAMIFSEILLTKEYKHVTIFSSQERVWTLTAASLRGKFKDVGIEVTAFHAFHAETPVGTESRIQELKNARGKSRGEF